MLGYCFSGLLTMLYLAGHPDAPIRSLVSLAPPIDYSASAGITKVFAEGRLEPDDILDEDGNVPGEVVREAFAMRKPTSDLVTNAALWDNLWKDDYVEGHQAMAQFIREQVPMPGALLRQIVDKLIRGNELATGATELSGRRVDLRDISCPLLVVMAERDELVPVESTQILREFMGPNMEELTLPAGHVGLITGPQGRHRDDPAHPRMDRGPQPVPAGERGRIMSSEKPPWRKAIEDYERAIGAPLEEFIKSDQFADMAAKAAKQQGQGPTPPVPPMPGMPGASTTEFLHAMNLPAASDIEELRAEVQALRDDVRALAELVAQDREQPEAAPTPEATSTPKARPAPKPKAKAEGQGQGNAEGQCQGEAQSGRQAATGDAKPKPKAE